MYGSSRLGIINRNISIKTTFVKPAVVNFMRGNKFFELSNHLGNVLVTLSDKKIPVASTTNTSLIDYYNADVITANDYAPFGSLLTGRNYNAPGAKDPRFGFNGKENDNEVKGEGNQQDYGFRIYDPRLGKFLSIDPLTKSFPFFSPYHYASNNPVVNIDLDGLEGKIKTGYADLNPVERLLFHAVDFQERLGRITTDIVPGNMVEYQQNVQAGQNSILFWLTFGEFTASNVRIPEINPSPVNSSTIRNEARYFTTLKTPDAALVVTGQIVKNEAAMSSTSAASNIVKNETTATSSGLKTLQVGEYSKMTKANVKTGLSADHIPSFAAIKKYRETLTGVRLTLAEEKELRKSTLTLVYETEIHKTISRTFAGRNNTLKIFQDARDLVGAIGKDIKALTPNLLKAGYKQADIDAAQKVLIQKYLPNK